MASAVPIQNNISKHYQIIVYATKGSKANVLNKLRIDLPLYPHQKVPRCNGISITNVWDDIRELTSGYFSGREPFRKDDGHIINKCQSPIKLLLRIILLSSMPGDLMFDPFAGMGTSLVVAKQLNRNYIGCEIDTLYYNIINNRLNILRECDDIEKFKNYYRYTNDIDII
jgi:DNA modification methylase